MPPDGDLLRRGEFVVGQTRFFHKVDLKLFHNIVATVGSIPAAAQTFAVIKAMLFIAGL